MIFFQKKVLGRFSCLGYFTLMFYVVFLSNDRWNKNLLFDERLHVIPFYSKIKYLSTDHSLIELCTFYIDIIGNILMFIPLPFYVFFILGRTNFRNVIVIAFLTSFLIEFIQFSFHLGVADIDDLLLNTLGAIIGLTTIKLIKKHYTAPR